VGEHHLHAPTLPALFAEAGRAVASLMLGDEPRGSVSVIEEEVVVDAPDREALLAAWIDELVFRAETRKAVFTEFVIDRADEREIAARIRGVAEPVVKTAVKAATFHNLRVVAVDGGFEATVVLDV
jgi:SHS2 domain-containing protein